VFIELLQRRDRLAVVAQLAIGIVLHHRNARRARRIEQPAPRRERQRRAGGILKARGDDDEAPAFRVR